MLEIYHTRDGSKTLYDTVLDETYHSRNGATKETEHVFVQAGLSFVAQQKQNISLLEIGFGTGLNALMTLQFLQKNPVISVQYVTLEPFPLAYSQVKPLDYIERCEAFGLEDTFEKMHTASADENIEIASNMSLKKHFIELTSYNPLQKFDLIYFDAFAPQVQPAMWEQNIFEKIITILNKEATLVTYCAKGDFKRTLKALGFEVQKLKGPPGKHQMTRAIWHS